MFFIDILFAILVLGLLGFLLIPVINFLPDCIDNYIEARRKWDEYKKQRRFDAEEPVKVAKPRKR